MSTQIQSDTRPAAAGKLAELRAKTDRDLAALLRRTLEVGFQLARQADYADAEALYARTAWLLGLAKGLRPQESTALDTRLHELRTYLDEVALAGPCLAG